VIRINDPEGAFGLLDDCVSIQTALAGTHPRREEFLMLEFRSRRALCLVLAARQ
jgi:hypothetical protein